MAFKMKAGKEGPMKKNFSSALKANAFYASLDAAKKEGRDTFKVGDETFDVKGSAKPKLKDNAPMMRMDSSAMKAMGKPAPVKAMDKSPMNKKLIEIIPETPKQQIPQIQMKSTIKKEIVDKETFENLKKNKSQKDLEKKRELGYDPKSREKMDYNPQTQRKG